MHMTSREGLPENDQLRNRAVETIARTVSSVKLTLLRCTPHHQYISAFSTVVLSSGSVWDLWYKIMSVWYLWYKMV
jgi:hypothetical protein